MSKAMEEKYRRLLKGPWRDWQERGLGFLELVPVKGKSVLDVGGRTGWAARRLKELGANVLVMDVFPTNHSRVSNLIQSDIPYVSTLDGIENKFDFVWCHHVLEHVQTPIDFLNRLSRIGKELWLAVPKFDGKAWAQDEIINFTMPVLLEHMRRGGWDIESCSYRTYQSVLQVVIQRKVGFVFGKKKTYPRYPKPLLAMNNTSEDYKRPGVDTWNWDVVGKGSAE